MAVQAQPPIPLEGWQTHLNYSNTRKITVAAEKIYAATENSLFYFDKEDNSLRKMSTIDGLSEIAISAMGYNPNFQTLILGYRNGNLDLLQENTIINLPSIREASVNSGKTINHVSSFMQSAYLATDFGVVVINLAAAEIRETWFPGENGEPIRVIQSLLTQDSIYLLTRQYLLSGSLVSGVNLQDFRNWQRQPLPSGEKIALALWQDEMILATANQLWRKSEDMWETLSIDFDLPLRDLSIASGNLVVVNTNEVLVVTPNLQVNKLNTSQLQSPWQAVFDNGTWWIADGESGLATNYGESWQSLFPAGPADNNTSQLFTTPYRIFALPPAKTSNNQPLNQPAKFSLFESNQWQTYGQEVLPPVEDLSLVLFDVINNLTWFGSYGDGLLLWDGQNFERINNDIPGSPFAIFNDNQLWVSSMALGKQGDVWVSIFNASPPLHRIEPGGNGDSYVVPGSRSNFIHKIIRYNNGDIWMAVAAENGGGIVVYNPDTQHSRLLTTTVGGGGLPSNQVNDLLVDRDGFIWVGTDEGVAYFPNPFLALANQSIDAVTPIFNQRRLLSTEKITALAIDGGNRKWVGTNNGVWLFGEAGEELFHNFHTGNSPLLNNEIMDIAVLNETGETFFATGEGIISFRSTSTSPSIDYEQVKIFPNPVNSDFQGLVGIEGLVNNSVVKITTLSGQLIRELRSYGGMATWDVTDYNNQRVSTGIYLVLMADENGEQDMVGKIAVIE